MEYAVSVFILFILCWHNVEISGGGSPQHPCESQIYCHGPLLEAMQNEKLFNDSKTFVDLNLKANPDVVLKTFTKLNKTGTATRHDLEEFLNQYFDGPGTEFEKWTPSDWVESPSFLEKITYTPYREWAKDLNRLWKVLGRKIKKDVGTNPQRYSLIYAENPFIVPGGRFREFYYWDSYWIIRGLLLSQMHQTVKGMLDNFLNLVKQYGFVPNGGRIYYTRRSQPPFLIPSFAAYLAVTSDDEFLRENLPVLETEYNFWMRNRTVMVETEKGRYLMNQYRVDVDSPRPESFREDRETASGLAPASAALRYAHLASAAESGWDFSSRWLKPNATSLTTIRTKEIVPVDLNAILCWNEKLLGTFHRRLGNEEKAKYFEKKVLDRQKTIMSVLWDPDAGIWYDWDLVAKRRRPGFYVSNILPMFAGCYGNDEWGAKEEIDRKVMRYLKGIEIWKYPTPVPASLVHTGQQWDFPNLWPPLQHMMVEALSASSLKEGEKLARELSERFLSTAYHSWNKHRHMYEKYDVRTSHAGGGGEYDVQVGFGWTNGVTLMLLDKYGGDVGVTSSAARSNFYIFTFLILFSCIMDV